MTRKRYNGLVRDLMNRINAEHQKNGNPKVPDHRVGRPKFGTIISTGKFEGQVLSSYQMSWDMMFDIFGPIFYKETV